MTRTTTTLLPLEFGQVWHAKLKTCPFNTIKIVGASERPDAWIVQVMPDGRHLTMTAEHIHREYNLSPAAQV
jgi:hypothetical protein